MSDTPRTDQQLEMATGMHYMANFACELERELAAAQARILELRDEVEILRLYGNKDCTSMADAVLAATRKGESDAK